MAHMIAMAKLAFVHVHMPAVTGLVESPDCRSAFLDTQVAPLVAAGLPADAPLAGHGLLASLIDKSSYPLVLLFGCVAIPCDRMLR